MDLPRFKKGGGINLNGPHITGYAVKTVVYEGPGVVMGADVLIITTDPKLSAAIAEYLNDQEVSKCSHVVLGQKPWYQSEHRDYDLDDMFPTNPQAEKQRVLDGWAAGAPRDRTRLRDE